MPGHFWMDNRQKQSRAIVKCPFMIPDIELQMGSGHPIAFRVEATEFGCLRALTSAPTVLPACHANAHRSLRWPPWKSIGLGDIAGTITVERGQTYLSPSGETTRLFPIRDPIRALLLYANSSNIDTVFINDELVLSQCKFTNVDWTK